MAKTCLTCRHASRQKIDEALLAGTPERAVAKEFGLARSSIHRHKESHLAQRLARSRQRQEQRVERQVEQVVQREIAADRSIHQQLIELADRIAATVDRAEQGGNIRDCCAAFREQARVLHLTALIQSKNAEPPSVEQLLALDLAHVPEEQRATLKHKLWDLDGQIDLHMLTSVRESVDSAQRAADEIFMWVAHVAHNIPLLIQCLCIALHVEPEGLRRALADLHAGKRAEYAVAPEPVDTAPLLTYTPDGCGVLHQRQPDGSQHYTIDAQRATLNATPEPARELSADEQRRAELHEYHTARAQGRGKTPPT